jgi:hypothetical protein
MNQLSFIINLYKLFLYISPNNLHHEKSRL